MDHLEGLNIMTPVNVPISWISATVVTLKKYGNVRLCVDLKPLNQALKRNHYPLPTIEDVLPVLSNARCITVLDAKNGFWHVSLVEESSYATTFGTLKIRKVQMAPNYDLASHLPLKTSSEDWIRH